MFPTHLLAGYVLGHVLFGESRLADWRHRPAWLGVLGAALPDLLDKPLAMVGVTESFHSVGHSPVGLVAVGLLALAWVAVGAGQSRSGQSRPWLVVWVAWASHLALDALHMVVNGRPGDVAFLAWPVVEHTPQVTLPPGQFAQFYVGTPAFLLEVGCWLCVGVVVVRSELTA
nr:metal-dependent hydrolase [Salinirubrum litoreum]